MPSTTRILMVEDDPQDAALAERAVRRADTTCAFLRVDTRDGMLRALREFCPDVVLTDHSLPNFSARDALRLAHEAAPGTPVIVVTGRLGDEPAVEYLQAGAADYIVKDHLQRLGPAVLRALDVKRSREAHTRALQLQAATYRIAQAALSSQGLEELFPAIHRIVGELMPATNFYVALHDPARDLLTFPYFLDEQDTDSSPRRVAKGLTEYVLRTGKPLLVTPEVQAELERRGEVELIGPPSIDWVGVPLRVADRTTGVLVAQTYAPGVRYGEREKEILEFVSTQVAMAIERNRVAEELRASETRLKAIIDGALDAVITMDGAGTIRSWSPQAERVFGWTAPEVVGQRLSATIIPPRYRDAHERGLARFLLSGEGPVLNQRIEITGRRHDGREVPVELTITPVRLGGAWLFSAFVRDISERRRADQRRAAQYALTRVLAEATRLAEAAAGILRAIAESLDWEAGALWILEPDGGALRCLEVWHGAEVDLGEFERVTRETTFARGMGLPGQVWATASPIWHPDVTTVASARFPRLPHATAAGVRGTFAFPIRGATDVTGVAEFFSAELRQPDPDLLELSASLGSQIGQFVERKRAEEALARSETIYRSLVDDSPFGIFRSTPDGRPLAVNRALVSMLGYASEAELLCKNIAEDIYADPEDRARLVREVTAKGTLTAESTWRRKDGTPVTVRQTGRVVRDARGAVEYFNVVVEDITERRLLEMQLRQAQKMEAIGRLAGGVAHDFNNVLTAIFGYADLVMEELPADSQSRKDLEEVRKAAQRASTLTKQLLAFSRQQMLAPVVLRLNDLVEDIDNMLRRLIGEDVELRLKLAKDLGNVRADPGQVQQVLLNLVVNARDAMPKGGRLLIETGNTDLTEEYAEQHQPVIPGAYVRLAVSDTGVGMTPEIVGRIFEPFFTTKEKGKGTGLGLSTVYGIVKQSSGYVWVYSEPGRGTTFEVYLPRVDAPVDTRGPVREAGTLAGNETLLLAEDDESLRRLVKGLLEKLGYTLLEAENAAQALALAGSHTGPVHLLVSDVVMPGASGRELARRLAESRPETKVLYMSGYTDDAIVHHGMLEPGLHFLQKLVTPAALARKVREVLDA